MREDSAFKQMQGWGGLVGCCLWGRRVGHDLSNLAAAAGSLGEAENTVAGKEAKLVT